MAASFPVVFTISSSSRHDFLILSTKTSLADLRNQISALAASSPNCAEFMSKYKKKDENAAKETVSEIKVKWAAEGRDQKIFPKETVVTEENAQAVFRMMDLGNGKDVLEVQMEQSGGGAK
ncbi:hypothetical protein EV356DRAFT_505630 [Viridothelium virens]|uniref:Uncharacterized protein n=1 Tax=Viridothelium virens TaxID=1048519 RepID=A0A6A6H3E9_VIRVR|nr:hypothetical protein EV356DRAFT_505630 [Viridothelium virens]